MKGLCPKCTGVLKLTRHHVYPKRYYGNKNSPIVWLCKDCHKEIESILPKEKLKKYEYLQITINFIKEDGYGELQYMQQGSEYYNRRTMYTL